MAFIPHGHPDRDKNLARFLDGNHEEVPDVAFHGTMDDFSQFKYESPTRVSRGLNRFGFWFDKNEKTPNYFAGYAQPSESRKPNVIAAHISMKNPLIFASDEIHPELQDKINEMAKRQDWNGINGLLAQKGHDDAFDKLMRLLPNGGRTRDEVVDQIKQQIMDDGYDGIILKNTMADHKTRGGRPTDWYLPFRSEQIKSAFGNQGTFDPNDPDITKAEGGKVESGAFSPVPSFVPYHEDPAFQEWFGNSVTHREGVPVTYYTGTSKDVDFSKFNVGRHGAWFTADPSEASEYAKRNDSMGYKRDGWKMVETNTASRVIPAHLKIENPYTGPLPESVLSDNYKKAQSDWFDTLRAKGHDGWIPEQYGGQLAVVLKEPHQIKSVNNRTWDPKNPRMDKAQGGEVEDDGITAYHGSPHDFDQFLMDRIGTGEGNQVYGHGLYFSENEDVARRYRDQLSLSKNKMSLVDRATGQPLAEDAPGYGPVQSFFNAYAHDMREGDRKHQIEQWATWKKNAEEKLKEWEDLRSNPQYADWIEEEIADRRKQIADWEAAQTLLPKITAKPVGRMYEVRINAHPDHLLDWDKPLSEQSEHVRKSLTALARGDDNLMSQFMDVHNRNAKADQLYATLTEHFVRNKKYENMRNGMDAEKATPSLKYGQQLASEALHNAGIKGIRYLDAGSRYANYGTRNYVVFDDKLVDVKRKYAAGGVVKESSDGKEAGGKAQHGRSRRKTPLIIDQYPTQYVPHVGRQVMQTGGSAIVKRALELTSQRRQRGR